MVVSEDMINMVDPHGFDNVFYRTVRETGLNHKTVFDILNGLYRKTYGISRYKNYESYRKARDRRIKQGANE